MTASNRNSLAMISTSTDCPGGKTNKRNFCKSLSRGHTDLSFFLGLRRHTEIKQIFPPPFLGMHKIAFLPLCLSLSVFYLSQHSWRREKKGSQITGERPCFLWGAKRERETERVRINGENGLLGEEMVGSVEI